VQTPDKVKDPSLLGVKRDRTRPRARHNGIDVASLGGGHAHAIGDLISAQAAVKFDPDKTARAINPGHGIRGEDRAR
jgi:hypothetical protein